VTRYARLRAEHIQMGMSAQGAAASPGCGACTADVVRRSEIGLGHQNFMR